jgi:hypothetical protein
MPQLNLIHHLQQYKRRRFLQPPFQSYTKLSKLLDITSFSSFALKLEPWGLGTKYCWMEQIYTLARCVKIIYNVYSSSVGQLI